MNGYKDHRAPEGRLSDSLDAAIARASKDVPPSTVCGFKGCGLAKGHKERADTEHITIAGL